MPLRLKTNRGVAAAPPHDDRMRRSYRRYRDSGVEWLGEVPAHWELKLLGLMGSFFKGSGGTKEDEVEDGVPCVRYGDIYTQHQYFIRETRADITEESAANYTPIRYGDVLFAGSGETIEEIGKSAVNLIRGPAHCGGDVIVFRPSIEADAAFLGYAADCTTSIYQKACMGRGVTVMHIYSQDLTHLLLPLPPLDEQRAIAAYLDRETERIDTLVAKQGLLIERLAEYRTALITRTVTRGLPPKAARAAGLDPAPRLKPSGVEWLGDVPEHWEVKRISAAARPGPNSFTDGDWIELPYITDSGVRLIQTGNVGIGTYREQGFRYIDDSSFDELRCTAIEPGDVLICRLADPVGRACLAPDLGVRMITSVDVCILKPSGQFSAEYLVFLLSSKQYLDHVDSLVRGGTRDRISRSMLGAIKIPSPPATEQRAIAAYLSQQTGGLDQLIDKAEAATERLQECRTALITAAVTGKIDVREPATVSGCPSE